MKRTKKDCQLLSAICMAELTVAENQMLFGMLLSKHESEPNSLFWETIESFIRLSKRNFGNHP